MLSRKYIVLTISGFVVVSVCLLVPAALVPYVFAATKEKKSQKRPSASRQLRRVVENFSRYATYEVSLSVAAGWSETSDHRIAKEKRKMEYTGTCSKEVLFVPSLDVYRTRKRAVACRESGGKTRCKPIQELASASRRKEVGRMHLVFLFPNDLLSTAFRYSKKAKWVKRQDSTGSEGVSKASKGSSSVIAVDLPAKEVSKQFGALLEQMEGSGSRRDPAVSNGRIEVEVGPDSKLPAKVYLTLAHARLGRRGEVKVKDGKILSGTHQVIRFQFTLSEFTKKKRLRLPKGVARALR